jgi:hypothetical protein
MEATTSDPRKSEARVVTRTSQNQQLVHTR